MVQELLPASTNSCVFPSPPAVDKLPQHEHDQLEPLVQPHANSVEPAALNTAAHEHVPPRFDCQGLRLMDCDRALKWELLVGHKQSGTAESDATAHCQFLPIAELADMEAQALSGT